MLEIRLLEPCPKALEFLKSLGHIQSVKADGLLLRVDYLGDETDQVGLLRQLIEGKIPIRSFTERGTTIEDVILNLEVMR